MFWLKTILDVIDVHVFVHTMEVSGTQNHPQHFCRNLLSFSYLLLSYSLKLLISSWVNVLIYLSLCLLFLCHFATVFRIAVVVAPKLIVLSTWDLKGVPFELIFKLFKIDGSQIKVEVFTKYKWTSLLKSRMQRIYRTMKDDNDYSSTFLLHCVTAGPDVYSAVFDTDFTGPINHELSRFSLHSLATASVSCLCTLSFPLLHLGKTYKQRQTIHQCSAPQTHTVVWPRKVKMA